LLFSKALVVFTFLLSVKQIQNQNLSTTVRPLTFRKLQIYLDLDIWSH